MSTSKQKVFVGLSGGVDSSVTAALLSAQGYEVVGVFMKNWSRDVGNVCCSSDDDLADARAVARQLGIKFQVWNFEREYYDRVIKYFLAEYAASRTPNPDVMCNSEIKFKCFLDRALAMGADLIATGHYARVENTNGVYHLLKGVDPSKDQSYFLYTLGQQELRHVLFPVGAMPKSEVRQLALQYQLATASKKDSQGICFVGKINVGEFLRSQIKKNPGAIIDPLNNVIGQHDGLAFYTLGQREGLPIKLNGPWYVVAKKTELNQLVCSKDPEDPLLWRREFIIFDVKWVDQPLSLPANVDLVIRYHHQPYRAHLIKIDDHNIQAIFDEPQRAITPGQAAVIYEGEELIGGGIIDSVQ